MARQTPPQPKETTAPFGTPHDTAAITFEELQLAARNHAMPLEALRYPITPAGLHYLLIHFDIPYVDVANWRLSVDGLVERPLDLSLDALRSRPAVSLPVTLECAGNGRALMEPRSMNQPWIMEAVGTAIWTGPPLASILKEAGLRPGALEILFTGLDRGVQDGETQDYQRSLTLDEALREEVLLAYEMNGRPLPPQHGFPLRLIVPGWYGMTHVKWLRRVTALAEPFHGYQQATSYHIRTTEEGPKTPVTRMQPRSLMEPPGIPDFFSRTRYLPPGPCVLRGQAWSGQGRIERVEVSVDGGRSWSGATLGEAPHASPYAWRPWSFMWEATPGAHDLSSRATDTSGRTQPLDIPWNTGGYSNNAVQHVAVVVG
jgi:sulfane dehydrogenase subunit SoxC